MLKIYNSLTQQKETFKPIEQNKLRMYVCGVTVYDECHIGHARTYAAFDLVLRYFKYLGYDTTYVRNITDIDDKIIKRAAENKESIDALTQKFTSIMHEEFHRLGFLPPDLEPRATETLSEMIAMIEKLIQTGAAYVVSSGDVYFDVRHFKAYGKLSHQSLEGLQSGIRVELNEQKRNPLDFVLWKAAKEGEPSWDSPWGKGRPGWHIECSAMSLKALGKTFDIHGGGLDLKFPHHENELAQSESANGCELAHYWMHTGMVQVNQEKMSKSLKNFFSIKDVLSQYPAEVVRYFLISSHYRSELHYSEENLKSAQEALTRLYTALKGFVFEDVPLLEEYQQRFNAAMEDDFNVPEALAVLFDLARELNKQKQAGAEVQQYAATLKKLGAVLGIIQEDPEHFFKKETNIDPQDIERLIEDRNRAKKNKDFKTADQIRDALKSKGIILEDSAQGTEWRKE